MTFATFFMLHLLSWSCARRIIQRYSEELEMEEFITNAPLDDILRVRFYMMTSWIMLGFSTIAVFVRL